MCHEFISQPADVKLCAHDHCHSPVGVLGLVTSTWHNSLITLGNSCKAGAVIGPSLSHNHFAEMLALRNCVLFSHHAFFFFCIMVWNGASSHEMAFCSLSWKTGRCCMTTIGSNLSACDGQSSIKAVKSDSSSAGVWWKLVISAAHRWRGLNMKDVQQEINKKAEQGGLKFRLAAIKPSKPRRATVMQALLKRINKKCVVCFWTGLAACMFSLTALCFLPVFCFCRCCYDTELTFDHAHGRWHGTAKTFPLKCGFR